MARLTVVPPAQARAERIEDLDEEGAADWLRRMMNVSRDLCDAIDAYLGPEHLAPRPQLRVITGGSDNHDQDQDVTQP